MSEQIKITIVSENGKLDNGADVSDGEKIVLTHDTSSTVMSTLLKNGLIDGSFCGGRGDCGRCRIRFLQGATVPTPLERSALEPQELRRGYRLACLARPKDDCVIALAFSDEPEIGIVSDMMNVTEKIDLNSQKSPQTKKQKPAVTESENARKTKKENGAETLKNNNRIPDTVIAVDLGTTTIVMQLVELETGRVVDTLCEMNPQRRYGADVLSRIRASCEGAREELQRLAEEVLERGVARFQGHGTAIRCMCIAGNTTMGHLLMGYDVSSLGRSPFTPVESGWQEYGGSAWGFPAYITPVISTFVGGDIVAGLYACGMLSDLGRSPSAGALSDMHGAIGGECRNEAGAGDGTVRFLIDLGTNGEMAVTNGGRMFVTATAAGPAFEGGAGGGVAGSDMVACTAALLAEKIADESGLLREPYFTEGVSVRKTGQSEIRFAAGAGKAPMTVTQADIRAIQMAKAAVRAGVEILWRRMGEPKTAQVYLAGGFGYYLDTEAAFRIGLLPEHMRGSVRAVGNTSLRGAFLLGRDLWLGRIDRASLEKRLSSIESVNLAAQAEFEGLYLNYMELRQS